MNQKPNDTQNQDPFPWRIYWREYQVIHDFTGTPMTFSGWTHNNHPEATDDCNPAGVFDSYASAMADAMGLWDEYCEFIDGRA